MLFIIQALPPTKVEPAVVVIDGLELKILLDLKFVDQVRRLTYRRLSQYFCSDTYGQS